jgi:hypothetical protein
MMMMLHAAIAVRMPVLEFVLVGHAHRMDMDAQLEGLPSPGVIHVHRDLITLNVDDSSLECSSIGALSAEFRSKLELTRQFAFTNRDAFAEVMCTKSILESHRERLAGFASNQGILETWRQIALGANQNKFGFTGGLQFFAIDAGSKLELNNGVLLDLHTRIITMKSPT